MEQYSLWKFFGIQRSGNHAVLNWLIGLDQDDTLFFNMVRVGKDLLDNPSGVSLPEGTRAYATRINGKRKIQPEHLDWFIANGGRLLLSYENYNISQFNESIIDGNILSRFGNPIDRVNIIVLRNPFNMLPSLEKMLRRQMVAKNLGEDWLIKTLHHRLSLWISYALLHLHPESYTRGKFLSILFDKWVVDKGYRDHVAHQLGYKNFDLNKDFVSDAGGGSSFSGTKLSSDEILNRWNSSNDGASSRVLEAKPEVIDLAKLIFGETSVPAYYSSYLTSE